MADHKIGTRQEWQAARDELQKLETEQGERNAEIRRKRRELPWVPVEKRYVFDTEDDKKTLELDRVCARERNRLPHLHGDGPKPVRGHLLLEGTLKGDPFGDEPGNWRKGEYPD